MSGALPVALLPRCALRHNEQVGVKESWLLDLSQPSYNLSWTCRNLPSCIPGGITHFHHKCLLSGVGYASQLDIREREWTVEATEHALCEVRRYCRKAGSFRKGTQEEVLRRQKVRQERLQKVWRRFGFRKCAVRFETSAVVLGTKFPLI